MEDKILCDVMHALTLETSKTSFLRIFLYRKALFVGIRIKIPENTFHFLKCQGIKNYF